MDRLVTLFQQLKARLTTHSEPSESTVPQVIASPAAPLVLMAGLALAVGLVFGVIGSAVWSANPPPAPTSDAVQLDPNSQDDYIIAVAEAYYLDQDSHLLSDRLARLHSTRIADRVQALALSYAPQRDVIAHRLAGLAVVLGSKEPSLVELNRQDQPALIAALSAQLGGVALIPPDNTPAPPTVTATATDNPTVTLPPGAGPNTTAGAAGVTPSAGTTAGAEATTPGQGNPPGPAIALNNGQSPATTTGNNSAASTPGSTLTLQRPTPAKSGPSKAAPIRAPIAARMPVTVPDYVGMPSTSIPLTARPGGCTPASQMPAVVDHTIVLCRGQQYAPFRVQGDTITIYSDSGGTAVVQGPPRGFAITATGNNIAIVGVHIAAATDPGDLNSWLCLYDACGYQGAPPHGAIGYGGGILLDNATNSAVTSAVVSGGTTGVVVSHGSNNILFNNNFSELNGWGILLLYTANNYLVANTTNHVNRACTDPGGNYLQSGCESSGIAAIQASSSLFFNNHCERSGNCIYASGVGGFASNNNQFFNNYCAGASANCYEVTFSQGNRFDYNVATTDPNTGDVCIYPFWIGGSTVQFGSHNQWNCKFSAQFSLNQSQKDTNIPTNIQGY
ncbi:MAG: right-handed parallel beta-helix repeat-containing protein [Anaerolineae bacterium]